MGASGWGYYYIEYRPDRQRAFAVLQARLLAKGEYWWTVEGKNGASVAAPCCTPPPG